MSRLLLALTVLAGCSPRCGEGRICVIAGTGELGFNGEGLDARESRLASPTSVRLSPDGDVVIVDYSNMRLRRLAADGTLVTIAGNGLHAYSEIGADPLDSPLENPVDAGWDAEGRLYILPQHEGRVIRVVDGVLERFAGTGELADSGDGGDALDAMLGYTGGMAFGPDGALFVSDSTHSKVRRIAPDGTIDTVLGTGEAGLGEEGYGPEVALRNPERVHVDGERLLVADTGNHRVLALDLATLETTWLAGTGEGAYGGDGGEAREAQLRSPTGLAVGEDGTVYVADLHNDAIRAIATDGTITTVAGGIEGSERASAPAADFALNRPAGLAWHGGDLWITERGGHRLLLWEAVDAP